MPDLITRCPSCSVTFHVKAVLLLPAKGMVRCGICQQQFNAITHAIAKQEVIDSEPAQKNLEEDDILIYDEMPIDEQSSDIAGVSQTLADEHEKLIYDDMPEEEVSLDTATSLAPKLTDNKVDQKLLLARSEAKEPGEPAPSGIAAIEADEHIQDDMSLEASEQDAVTLTAAEKGVAREVSDTSLLPSEEQEDQEDQEISVKPVTVEDKPLFEPLSPAAFVDEPVYQTAEVKKPRSSAYRFGTGLGVILLLLLLALQYAHFNAVMLGNNPLLTSHIYRLCQVTGCDPIYRDLQKLEIRNLVVSDHPTATKALRISGQLGNLAAYQQPLPRIVVSFEDLNGSILVRRAFAPAEYLNGQATSTLIIKSRHQVNFQLDLVDPGEQAQSYTVSLQ